jgi:hypothetical protein
VEEVPQLIDLLIAALQTFAVLFLACGIYLATHKTNGSQISPEPAAASPTPASFWREGTALAGEKPRAQIQRGGSAH